MCLYFQIYIRRVFTYIRNLCRKTGFTCENARSHAFSEHVCDTFWIKQAPAEAPATPAPAPAAPVQQTTASQVASEAKNLVDKTAAELKPALNQAVQDKVNPIAQELAKKLEPITGDVSSHVNTALAEGVKQLNPIVDDVSSKAKNFVDDAAKEVRSLTRNITLHYYLLYVYNEW